MTAFPDHAAESYDERIVHLVPGFAKAARCCLSMPSRRRMETRR